MGWEILICQPYSFYVLAVKYVATSDPGKVDRLAAYFYIYKEIKQT